MQRGSGIWGRGNMEERGLPTAGAVLEKIKDDGDFDALRLKIIRKVKENEELRNSIISQVKESDVLYQDGSEVMKPRQLSDAIYQELGRKIMGQISDEIWKVISSDGNIKDDIKGTVESVYNKMVFPEHQAKNDANHSSPRENQIVGREANGIENLISTPTNDGDVSDPHKTNEPLGFGSSDSQVDESKKSELQELGQMCSSPEKGFSRSEGLPPGFSLRHGDSGNGGRVCGVDADDDCDLPPGFDCLPSASPS